MIDQTRMTLPRIRMPVIRPLKLAKPGDPLHTQEAAQIAARRCVQCGLPIGYGQPLWFVGTVHGQEGDFTSSTGQEVRHAGCELS